MDVQSMYQTAALQSVSGYSPGKSFFGGVPKVSSGVRASFQNQKDVVDLVGLESVGEAFRTLNNQEPLPIPEPVGNAIRVLVKEVLQGLPGG